MCAGPPPHVEQLEAILVESSLGGGGALINPAVDHQPVLQLRSHQLTWELERFHQVWSREVMNEAHYNHSLCRYGVSCNILSVWIFWWLRDSKLPQYKNKRNIRINTNLSFMALESRQKHYFISNNVLLCMQLFFIKHVFEIIVLAGLNPSNNIWRNARK